MYTAKIYAALENCILFINSHLKLIKTDSFGNIKVIEQKRIIGFEAILDVHIHTEDDRVKMKTRKIFQSVISKQIENIDMIETIVIDEFLAPLLSKIEDLKEKIPIEPQESIKALKVVLKLIEETQQFMIEKLRRYDMMSSIQINTIGNQETDENGIKVIKLNEMDGTDTTPSGPQLLKGFYEEIMIKVNNTVNNFPYNFQDIQKTAFNFQSQFVQIRHTPRFEAQDSGGAGLLHPRSHLYHGLGKSPLQQ